MTSISKYISITISILIGIFFLASCNPEDITTDPDDKLSFSHDTISFDTVFVTFGSTTFTEFVAYNPHSAPINVSSIKLGRGKESPFTINVDGLTGQEVNDITIWAEDSLHIFVEVTVDPNDELLPFIVEDSLIFETNGNIQDVQLEAYGQNAHFFGPNTPNGAFVGVTGDTTWTNDLPYVVLDYVIVDSLSTLTILPSTEINMHNGSIMYVKGSLNVLGGQDTTTKVVFQGTRREWWYDDIAGQWGAIWLLRGSVNNIIDNAIIQNSIIGVRVDSLPISGTQPNLILTNSIIRHAAASGLLGITSVISGANLMIYDCGTNNVQLEYGGAYAFNHCTFVNSNGADHQNPVVVARNYLPVNDSTINIQPLSLSVYNSIILGSLDEELVLDPWEGTEETFSTQFTNCLIKSKEDIDRNGENIKDCLFASTDNVERDIFIGERHNYRLIPNSPCIDRGTAFIENPLVYPSLEDFDGVARDEFPDIGCFEFVPE